MQYQLRACSKRVTITEPDVLLDAHDLGVIIASLKVYIRDRRLADFTSVVHLYNVLKEFCETIESELQSVPEKDVQ